MRDWDQHYREGFTPWDTGDPERLLVAAVDDGTLSPGRALEIGCGTGTNALWLHERGYDVVAIDVAPTALERARDRADAVDFRLVDVLEAPLPDGPFDVVFDRGVFHVFEEDAQRDRVASEVARVLRTGGRWLSLLGSTEGPPRDTGPPRRSALEVVRAIEPHLAIHALRSVVFADEDPAPAAWVCVSEKRAVPAQPSTRRGG